MKLLTRKYKYATKYATNLLLGVLCAYSVCACDNIQRINPNGRQPDNERPDSSQYEPNPTDTDQDKQDNQEHQETPDNQWEQPDENHNETPDNQWEQPDENHNENPDNQWEQPDQDHNENPNDQDNQWEQPDENHQEKPDEQNDQDDQDIQGEPGKCDPGYVWVDNSVDSWVIDDGISVNNQCVACASLPSLVKYIQYYEKYCPGGENLNEKNIMAQIKNCPLYGKPIEDFSRCVCYNGLPPSSDEKCPKAPQTLCKKPLIISPKVNVISNHRKVNNQMLMRTKIRKAKAR